MQQEIRHRRLYAFFNSKVLNVLVIIGFVTLMQAMYMQSLLLPTVCSAVAFSLFIGYAIWLWVKRPKQIVINKMISNGSVWFTLYFVLMPLILRGNSSYNVLWCALPVVAAIILFFISMISQKDEIFDI